jgi:hypothetical protein
VKLKDLETTENMAIASNLKITSIDLRRRWGKLDEVELAAIRTSADLLMQVQAKYGLGNGQARADVDVWANGRDF